jgi:CHAT domain-containing protein
MDGVLAFVVRTGTLTAVDVPVGARALARTLERLERDLAARAEVREGLGDLGRWLRAPLERALADVRRVALVTSGGLRRVPFAALPTAVGGAPWVERVAFVHALHLRAAFAALVAPPGVPVAPPDLAAVDVGRGARAHLPFAAREVRALRETWPRARTTEGGASRLWLGDRLATPGAWIHFAGHAEVDAADPLASALVAVDGPLPLYAALSRSVAAALVVWSSCGLFVDEPEASERWALGHALSGPEAALSFGGRVVVAAARDVDDLDAARLMKHLYRGLGALDVAEALRAAQLRLRGEHPATWASHAVWVGGG